VAFVGGGVPMLLTAVGTSVLLHQVIFDQIISPRILGGHVGLHPIISIVALLAGNLLLGIIGMILAVPVAACIQMAVIAFYPKLAAVEIPESGGDVDHARLAAMAEEGKGLTETADDAAKKSELAIAIEKEKA
jgi:predicted PurR-regulated permease PerM